jgi:hypothetical protein
VKIQWARTFSRVSGVIDKIKHRVLESDASPCERCRDDFVHIRRIAVVVNKLLVVRIVLAGRIGVQRSRCCTQQLQGTAVEIVAGDRVRVRDVGSIVNLDVSIGRKT